MEKDKSRSVITVGMLACSVLMLSASFIGCGAEPAKVRAPVPLVPIMCDSCHESIPNTEAFYHHGHAGFTVEWSITPGLGPDPDGHPAPQPCPSDGTPCNPDSLKCNTCGWTEKYLATP